MVCYAKASDLLEYIEEMFPHFKNSATQKRVVSLERVNSLLLISY